VQQHKLSAACMHAALDGTSTQKKAWSLLDNYLTRLWSPNQQTL